jgi:5-hydroxyisourate hydrolase
MHKSPITCHVLDSSTGKPAAGVEIRLQEHHPPKVEGGPEVFAPFATGKTNSDGRCLDLLPHPDSAEAEEKQTKLTPGGLYKIVFKTKDYFEGTERKCFYPWVEITFQVADPSEHYHIPLLISPYSFTTYRGS